jgi:hypothetical protein
VAEQLALYQLAAEGGAVHLDQGLRTPRAAIMQRIGHQLLAGPALAADQHGDVGVGDLVDGLEQTAHGRSAADDVAEAEIALDLRQ